MSSSIRFASRRSRVLVTAATALALAAVPAVAVAAPAGDAVAHRAVTAPMMTDVPVDGGITTFSLSAKAQAALKAKGVVLADVDTEGNVQAHVYGGAKLSLGVKAGAVANVKGKLGGRIQYSGAGVAFVNVKTKKFVKVTDFEADLTTGTLSARVDGDATVRLGTFVRPNVSAVVDAHAGLLNLNTNISVSADAAARLNAALGADCFVGGSALLDVRGDISLDAKVDLNVALGLKLKVDLDLGAILGIRLGGRAHIG
ncbi:hypothetical protein ABT160_11855 [Streptomyces sp. NPDC001941]|uniref:hypothetical protein n=1 Tax=Streptomyces sp. NPDC001941 TaxID=3154659 RepID=UPI003329F9CA